MFFGAIPTRYAQKAIAFHFDFGSEIVEQVRYERLIHKLLIQHSNFIFAMCHNGTRLWRLQGWSRQILVDVKVENSSHKNSIPCLHNADRFIEDVQTVCGDDEW